MAVPSNTFGGIPLYSPARVRQARDKYLYDEIPELKLANSFYASGGIYPSRGWLLMRQADYNPLDEGSLQNLVIQDFGQQQNPNPPLTFKNLVIVQARCVSRGMASDPDSLFLVEVSDKQQLLWNQWWQQPTNTQYNIRAPAYPGQFYSLSTNVSTPWTWATLLQNVWTHAGLLGAWPGLPPNSAAWTAPTWTPEGWSFPGVSVWRALNTLLAYVGLTVTVDLTQASPYGLAPIGVDQDGSFATLAKKFLPAKEDDWEYIDSGAGRIPTVLDVLFHMRNQYYGTEETVRRDGEQWTSEPLYTVQVHSPIGGGATSLSTSATLWADFTVQEDIDGNPLPADVTTANSVANQLAAYYYSVISRGTQGYLRRRYAGALPWKIGGLVDGVCWRQDEQSRLGWTTTIVRGKIPPFPEVTYGCPDGT